MYTRVYCCDPVELPRWCAYRSKMSATNNTSKLNQISIYSLQSASTSCSVLFSPKPVQLLPHMFHETSSSSELVGKSPDGSSHDVPEPSEFCLSAHNVSASQDPRFVATVWAAKMAIFHKDAIRASDRLDSVACALVLSCVELYRMALSLLSAICGMRCSDIARRQLVNAFSQ